MMDKKLCDNCLFAPDEPQENCRITECKNGSHYREIKKEYPEEITRRTGIDPVWEPKPLKYGLGNNQSTRDLGYFLGYKYGKTGVQSQLDEIAKEKGLEEAEKLMNSCDCSVEMKERMQLSLDMEREVKRLNNKHKETKEDSPYSLYEKHKPKIDEYFNSLIPDYNKAIRACLLVDCSENLIEPPKYKSEEIKEMKYEYIETTSLEDMTKQIALKQKEGWELDGDTQPFHWDRKQYNDTFPQQKYLQRIKWCDCVFTPGYIHRGSQAK